MNICRGKCLRHACRQQFINSLRFAPGIKASLYFRAPSFYNQAPIHNFQSENIRLEPDQKYFFAYLKMGESAHPQLLQVFLAIY